MVNVPQNPDFAWDRRIKLGVYGWCFCFVLFFYKYCISKYFCLILLGAILFGAWVFIYVWPL